jgi:hypothetical protein
LLTQHELTEEELAEVEQLCTVVEEHVARLSKRDAALAIGRAASAIETAAKAIIDIRRFSGRKRS